MTETLNAQPDSSNGADIVETISYEKPPAAESQTPEGEPNPDDTKDPKEGEPSGEKPEEKEPPKGKPTEEPKEKPKGDEFRFDKHPRWQEMRRKADRVDSLELELNQLKQAMQARKDPEYNDVFKMNTDDIRDQFDEDPRGFLENFAKQIQTNTLNAVNQTTQSQRQKEQETQYNTALQKTFNEFGDQNDDFWDLWDEGNGPIKQFMDQNVGHNAISAYMSLKAEENEKAVQEKIDAAVKKAVAEAEQTWTKNQRIKRHATVLGGGPSATPVSDDATLKNPEKYGGLTSVLADRIRAMRQGA